MSQNPLSLWNVPARRLALAQICDMIEVLRTDGKIRRHIEVSVLMMVQGSIVMFSGGEAVDSRSSHVAPRHPNQAPNCLLYRLTYLDVNPIIGCKCLHHVFGHHLGCKSV